MKLYEVTNGFLGNGEVHCLVVAPDEATAIRLASESFKRSADAWAKQYGENNAYPDRYWQESGLRATVMFADVDTPQATRPRD